MMRVVLREIARGPAATIYAIGSDTDCPVLDFLEAMGASNPDEVAKAVAVLEFTKDHGPPKNKQKCRYFREEKLFELKNPGGIRIMAFWDEGKVIICAHAFHKKEQKTRRSEIDRATELRGLYSDAKSNDRLFYMDFAGNG